MMKKTERNEADCIQFCQNYYNATSIPVTLRRSVDVLYNSQGETMRISKETAGQNTLYNPHREKPDFAYDSPEILYARIPIYGTMLDIFLGPVLPLGLTEAILHKVMISQMLPVSYKDELADYLQNIPRLSRHTLARHIILIDQIINHETITLEQIYDVDLTEIREQKGNTLLDWSTEDAVPDHSFEQELFRKVAGGSKEQLQQFLQENQQPLFEIPVSDSPLRNAKDQFIAFASRLGLLAGIPAGIPPEKIDQLTALYVRQAEAMRSVEEIETFRRSMLFDYCEMAENTRMPAGLSYEISETVSYIRARVNVPLSIDEIAAHLHRSRSWLMHQFRKELGITIGECIRQCRLEEAKNLLTDTNRSLSEISDYLCFSSQSYFQNVFRKKYGETPLSFRKRTKQKA